MVALGYTPLSTGTAGKQKGLPGQRGPGTAYTQDVSRPSSGAHPTGSSWMERGLRGRGRVRSKVFSRGSAATKAGMREGTGGF